MLELDFLVGKFAVANLTTYSSEDLEKFERDILSIETPDLHRLVMMQPDEISKFDLDEDHYIHTVRDFIQKRPWEI